VLGHDILMASDGPKGFSDLVRKGRARIVLPTTDAGYKSYGAGRLPLPAATNLCPDPQGTALTFWPSDTANTDFTANQALPIPIPGQPLITKCLKMVNNGTADAPVTANITVIASTSYNSSIYVYAPTLGGNLTITDEVGHTFTLAALTVANAGWVLYGVRANTVAGEVTKRLKFTFAGGGASTVYVTGFNPVASTVLTPYFDGTYSGCAWTGAADASTSTRTVSGLIYPAGTSYGGIGTFACRFKPLYSSAAIGGVYSFLLNANGKAVQLYFFNGNSRMVGSLAAGAMITPAAVNTFNANTTHHTVFRWDATNLDLSFDGSDTARVAHGSSIATLTELDIGFQNAVAGREARAYMGPAIVSPARKSDAWGVAIQYDSGVAFSDPMRLFRDFMDVGDVLFPLSGDSVGYMKTAGSGIPFVTNPLPLSLRFDDINDSDYSLVFPELVNRGMVGGFAAYSIAIGGGGRITLAQLLEMQSGGMEIMHHSRSHGADPANYAAFVDETVTAANEMRATGLNIRSFVQPGSWVAGYNINSSAFYGTLEDIALRSNFDAYEAYIGSAYRSLPMAPSERWGAGSGSGVTVAVLNATLDTALRIHDGLSLTFHQPGGEGGIDWAIFTGFLDYVATKVAAGLVAVVNPTTQLAGGPS